MDEFQISWASMLWTVLFKMQVWEKYNSGSKIWVMNQRVLSSYQMPKYCIEVSNTVRLDFTTQSQGKLQFALYCQMMLHCLVAKAGLGTSLVRQRRISSAVATQWPLSNWRKRAPCETDVLVQTRKLHPKSMQQFPAFTAMSCTIIYRGSKVSS